MNDKERWRGNMACQFYVDFTRMCIEKFPTFVRFTTLQTCESEQYVDCPLYQVCTSNFNCEYLPSCSRLYDEKIPKFVQHIFINKELFKVFKNILMNYCLSPEKSKTCAKYQLYSKGETPPLNLMPDGSRMSPFDFLVKRKIISPPPK